MFADFAAGVGYLFRGFRLIRQRGLRRYFVGPIVVNITVFVSLIWFGAAWFTEITQKLMPQGGSWLSGFIEILIWVLIGLIVLVFGFFVFTLAVNFIGAPFNGLLSEKVERKLAPPELESRPRKSHFFSDIFSSIAGEVKKYSVFLVVWILLIAATVTPIVNIVTGPPAAILAPIFGAWMMALEYISYPMNNHNKYFSDVRRWLRKNRMLGLGFGFAVMVATLVPVLNLIVMPAAVAGATALWVERRDIDSVKLY
ncbi:MAG: sulfate transporter CysZ [Acidiferrobacterales bacterium]